MASEGVTDEIVQRLRTFTLTRWCGMPTQLSPRKLAKMGFMCEDKQCTLKCADRVNCAQVVQL